jgi:uncharacterized protein (DUF1015 family)
MAKVRPFLALRPDPKVVDKVASVPYDVVDRAEAAQLAGDNPLSFLRVSRAEIDLPEANDVYGLEIYARAEQNFQQLIAQHHLVREERPSLYVYRLKMGEHVQVGVAAAFSVDEYDTDRIKKHEKTRREKEDDRTRHIVTLRAQTGPVFLTYRGNAGLNALVEQVQTTQPLYDLVAVDGIAHTLWKVDQPEAITSAFEAIPTLYIADGHHRAASASRARAQLKQQATDWTGEEPANTFLAVAFPSDQLSILPYNRIVVDLNGRTPEQFCEQVARVCTLSAGQPRPSTAGHVSMYCDKQWFDLKLPQPQGASPADKLDVAILQSQLLAPLLGVDDPRTSKRIDFVGGIRGTDELVKLVDSGKASVAFSMFPTSVDELMAISDADEIMPPKSTWFEPKLRDALLIHSI